MTTKPTPVETDMTTKPKPVKLQFRADMRKLARELKAAGL